MEIFSGEPSMATVIGLVVIFIYMAFFMKKKKRQNPAERNGLD